MADINYIEEFKAKKASTKVTFKRSPLDRRSGEDKRDRYNLDYFMDGGQERRKGKERRQSEERRSSWVRVYRWCSVFLGQKAS